MTPWNDLIAGVEQAYHDACEKHPKFADELVPPDLNGIAIKSSIRFYQSFNDSNSVSVGHTILCEELMETYDAVINEGNQAHALEEVNQLIAVCLRFKEELMKSKPFGQDYWKGGEQ